MAETRKIAAILAADVVGFSRMASADEDRTLARLRMIRSELIDPTVASQNGRVFKRTGDGALVEFRSIVEAVRKHSLQIDDVLHALAHRVEHGVFMFGMIFPRLGHRLIGLIQVVQNLRGHPIDVRSR